MAASDDTPALLARLSPTRALLVGPAGAALTAAGAWAAAEPALAIARRDRVGEVAAGDLIACESATALPVAAAGMNALVPAGERDAASARGWSVVARTDDGLVLLAGAGGEPGGLPAPTLESYRRTRARLSRELRRPAPAPTAAPAPGPSAAPRPSDAADRDRVAIVVPIHNAAADLRRCLDALVAHTTWPCELWLIDDASTEPEIAAILDDATRLPHVRVLRNAINLGFTATVNRALRACDGDVVLLNSDARVGPRWLEQLIHAARSRPDVATVTPVSDNGGAFSVPEPGANELPPGLDPDTAARRLSRAVGEPPAATPTGNGFCLYIRRAALAAVGNLDERGFPRGYGEENDFCMRAGRLGWSHLVDGRTFVAHRRGASFRSEREQVGAAARAQLDERYPEYTAQVRAFASGEAMARLRAQVRTAWSDPKPPRPRVLFVLPEGSGGMAVANLELMRALRDGWEPWMLTSDRRTLRLSELTEDEPVQREEWTLQRPLRAADLSRRDYREIVAGVLAGRAFELVHMRHVFKHTFDLPAVAAELGIPLVVSFHDFYLVCPTIHLLDDRDRYCAGECTPGDGSCRIPDAGLGDLPHLKHAYVHQWRAEAEAMLRHAGALVTTSEHARAVHRRALPSLRDRPFEVIGHGRTLRQQGAIAAAPQPGGSVRVLVVANLDVHKGADYLRALRAAPGGERIELHLLGAVPDAHADLGVRHGPFAPGELAARAATISPAFAGCFSVAAETWSHALTEAWALGLPVLATDLGAPGERIRAHGGGRLLPVDDPAAAAALVLELADDPAAYAAMAAQATLRGCPSVGAMADAYDELYRRVIDDRRPLRAPSAAGASVARTRGTVRMLGIVDGADGVHPGSAFVRVLCRWRHPSVRDTVSLRLRAPEDDPVRPGTDVVLVQRSALEPDLAETLLAALAQREIPLVLDLDDHLLLEDRDDPLTAGPRAALEAACAAASLVLVPNAQMAAAVAPRARAVAVVPNLLDERLFLSGVTRRPRRDRGRGPVQLVYIASPSHGGDLALLAPVMAALERERPGAFRLNVVGAEPPGPAQDWYHRVVVPDDRKPYPRFVGWLREHRARWDLALAPLRDTPFHRCKSDLKYLEYSALGLPGIYADLDPYAGVRDGETGLCATAGETGAWTEAIRRLAEDPRLAERLADAAFAEVCAGRLMGHGAGELLELLGIVAAPR